MASLAPKYGVSAVFLSRVCARLNIPRPSRGYWARKRSGQRLEIPPLPAPTVGIPSEWRRGDQLPRTAVPKPIISNPKKAGSQSLILMGVLSSFTKGRVAGDGYLKPVKRNLPDFVVTEPSLSRAASALQKLANRFHDAKCRISVACSDGGYTRKVLGNEQGRLKRSGFETDLWSPRSPTLVFIDEVAIGLSIYEQTVEKEMVYLDGRYVPVKEAKELKPGLWDRKAKTLYSRSTQRIASKRLCLRAYSPYPRVNWEHTWTEDKGSLAKQCDDIVAYLLDRAMTVTLEVEEADRQADEDRKRWEAESAIAFLRHERSLIIRAREESQKNLQEIIETWSHDRKVQAFFDDIAAKSVAMNNEDRARLLSKVHEAKNLLACADSAEALMSWVPPPPKPTD
ncbi:hypothetical protein [Pseudomonas sp. R11-23-07]|uniref:hypothetical protein n=1 Tax=Pseudomonas sp. R11-23-07 TaxID=658632 RepID=UPI002114F43B|nr:hypothetical protein [Pseudomonas sp. R11-23-07]